MIILDQDSCAIYDTDKFGQLCVQENKLYLITYTGEVAYPIGQYKTKERCSEIVREIFALMDCTNKYDMPIV